MTWQEFIEKLQRLLTSRKFWALVASLATVWTTYFTVPGAITPLQAVQATVAALAAFAVSTAIEDNGRVLIP